MYLLSNLKNNYLKFIDYFKLNLILLGFIGFLFNEKNQR